MLHISCRAMAAREDQWFVFGEEVFTDQDTLFEPVFARLNNFVTSGVQYRLGPRVAFISVGGGFGLAVYRLTSRIAIKVRQQAINPRNDVDIIYDICEHGYSSWTVTDQWHVVPEPQPVH